uniref:Protein phosphatase n=1 Tax=Vitis vinifera TaxID=29760 RepID=A5B357_VITVI|nr:hypothetical protein VITISV_028052 [Vitis vinifera]
MATSTLVNIPDWHKILRIDSVESLHDSDEKPELEMVHATRSSLRPQVIAQKIAVLARQRAQDKNWQTLFSTAAQDAGFRYYGGKLNDITTVVSYITSHNNGCCSSNSSWL